MLQERLTERTVATALAAGIGPITLCCEPDATHDTFLKMVARMKITLRPQPQGDLGTRMLAAVAISTGPILVIGTDCPALTEAHLRSAAMALRDGNDVVLIPAERGGYVLLGMRKAQPALFSNIAWGGSSFSPTRARASSNSVSCWSSARRCGTSTRKSILRVSSANFPNSSFSDHCKRIKTRPQTMRHAAMTRTARKGSFKTTTAIAAPNSTLVSRKVATIAIGAAVIAQIAMP